MNVWSSWKNAKPPSLLMKNYRKKISHVNDKIDKQMNELQKYETDLKDSEKEYQTCLDRLEQMKGSHKSKVEQKDMDLKRVQDRYNEFAIWRAQCLREIEQLNGSTELVNSKVP